MKAHVEEMLEMSHAAWSVVALVCVVLIGVTWEDAAYLASPK